MEPAAALPCQRFATRSLAVLIALFGLPLAARAADAHQAVQARPGDIVLLRNVSTRPAVRPAPPGMALMVSPSPAPEISASLGTGELSDEAIARLGATPSPGGQLAPDAAGHALEGVLARSGSDSGVASNGASDAPPAAPPGVIGDATRGIGGQVQGALAQFPFGHGH